MRVKRAPQWVPSISRNRAAGILLLAVLAAVVPGAVLAQGEPPVPGTVELVPANPDAGFYWPYYLVIPDTVPEDTTIILEAIDSDVDLNDPASFEPDEDAESRANYFGLDLFLDFSAPMVMAVLPHLPMERFDDNEIFWAIHLDDDTFTTDLPEYRRLDEQVLAMVADARARLAEQNITATERVFVDGFSSTGIFALRFSMLHPDKVLAAAVGGAGIHMMPVAEWEGETLTYPMGTADYAELTGKEFDLEAFRDLPLYIYVGSEDTNDPVGTQSDFHAALTVSLFGEDVTDRFNAASQVYATVTGNSEFAIYDGVGHGFGDTTFDDIKDFFRRHRVDPDILINGSNQRASVGAGQAFPVSISLDPGSRAGTKMEWWITADTDLGTFSYVHPAGWSAGLKPAVAYPLFAIPGKFKVLNAGLPAGTYTFTFGIDETPDGVKETSWEDSVTVEVQ